MTSPSADDKRLAELRDFLTNPQQREQVAGMMWRDSGVFLLRLLDALQARVFDAENDAKNVRELYLREAKRTLELCERLAEVERNRDERLMRQAEELGAAQERASALAAALTAAMAWLAYVRVPNPDKIPQFLADVETAREALSQAASSEAPPAKPPS